MKIAVRAGHTEKVTGANGFINELKEDRKVKDAVIKYLKALGHEVLDVTPPVSYSGNLNQEMSYGTSKANNWNADLFISVHFNATGTTQRAVGTEVCVHSKFETAQRVVDKLAGLGFINRGQKVRGNSLHELRVTNMKAMIIECCFVSSKEDTDLYKSLGYDKLGKAIAEGVSNKNISSTPDKPVQPSKPTPPKPSKPQGNAWVLKLQKELNKQGYKDKNGKRLVEDGLVGVLTLSACPTLIKGTKGNITRLMQEKLNSLGYATNGIDGIFGNGSHNAVKKFQSAKKLVSDGICGQGTWRKLLGL